MRATPELNGEYRITLYEEEHLTRFDIEVEHNGNPEDASRLEEYLRQEIKTRLGVRPKRVLLLAPEILPRHTHKAKRVIDTRSACAL